MVGLYNFLSRYGQVVAFVVGLALIVAYLITVQSGIEQFSAMNKEDQMKTTIFNIGLMSAIGLILAAVVLVFLFALFDLVFNPKNSLRSIALLLFIGLLFFLGYSMAQADEAGKLAELYQKYQITPFIAKLIGQKELNMARRSTREKLNQEINAGSMADIAFLLLIFFLVTTTIAEDKGVLVKLPPWVEEDQPEQVIKERNVLTVLINAQNQLLVEGEEMDIDDLREAVHASLWQAL